MLNKLVLIVLVLILIFSFSACSKPPERPLPDLNTVLTECIGKTEKELKGQIGSLGIKEDSYLKHHFGDISFPDILIAYPKDAVSYKYEGYKTKLYSYEYSSRLLFVAKSLSAKEKVLSSVSYSFDSKEFSEIYSAVKNFHENFISDYQEANFNDRFKNSLISEDEFFNYFNETKEKKHTYTEDSVGISVSTHTKKGQFPKIADERDVAVLNYYEDSSFTNNISLSVHYIKDIEAYRFNVVYQSETLILKYNPYEYSILYYKKGDVKKLGTIYYYTDLFALDF